MIKLNETDPKHNFKRGLSLFIKDLLKGEIVTSRKNESDISNYALALPKAAGMSSSRVPAAAITLKQTLPISNKAPKRQAPKEIAAIKTVPHDAELEAALKSLDIHKLRKLYYSITTIAAKDHAPLLALGLWCMVECTSAAAGRKSAVSFPDFFTTQRMRDWEIRIETSALRDVLRRVADYGNAMKHDPVSAMFSGEQVANDIAALTPLLIACARQAIEVRRGG